MGYFDSAKNRVQWNKELEGLRELKKQFQETGVDPYAAGARTAVRRNGKRLPMNFSQLEREEERSVRRERVPLKNEPAKTLRNRTLRTPELKTPEMKARSQGGRRR